MTRVSVREKRRCIIRIYIFLMVEMFYSFESCFTLFDLPLYSFTSVGVNRSALILYLLLGSSLCTCFLVLHFIIPALWFYIFYLVSGVTVHVWYYTWLANKKGKLSQRLLLGDRLCKIYASCSGKKKTWHNTMPVFFF